MSRVLVVFAHPSLQVSRVQRALASRAPGIEGVTFHDLYERYPDYDIDVEAEQALLLEHDVIVWQHPFYWYSTPPLLKQWIDLVLEHGWAYGSKGTKLHGKHVLSVISAGGPLDAYCEQGYNRYSVRQLLAPLEQTARLCGMTYLPPWLVFGTHRLDDEGLRDAADAYADLLRWLVGDGHKEVDADFPGLITEVSKCTPWPEGAIAEAGDSNAGRGEGV